MKFKFFITFLVYSCFIFGQTIQNWNNFTNKQSVVKIALDNTSLWAATEGGVFRYFYENGSYLQLTKSEGLSSQSTTAIAVDNKNKIWIGTSEGYINVYDPANGNIEVILEIFKSNKSIKRINDISISGDTAFVSNEF